MTRSVLGKMHPWLTQENQALIVEDVLGHVERELGIKFTLPSVPPDYEPGAWLYDYEQHDIHVWRWAGTPGRELISRPAENESPNEYRYRFDSEIRSIIEKLK